MMSKRLIAAGMFFLLTFSLFPITLKLGSLAPAGTAWDKSLNEVASEWSRISKGKVILKIYPGGIAGDEAVMIRKMRQNTLHGAAITAVGINQIYQGTLAISVPMLIQTDKEFDYVLDKVVPYFNEKIEEKRFKAVMWTFAGWVHWFGKEPIKAPADLARQKMWIWKGNSDEAQMWKEMGFQPVLLDVNDLMTSLSSGMVDAFGTTQLSAAAYQWFGISQNMCDLNWAPMLAGVVFSKKAWDSIPAQYHEAFLEVLNRIGARINGESKEADSEALEVMKKYGLTVHTPSSEDLISWQEMISENFDEIIDKQVGREAFEVVSRHLKEYRAKNEN